MCRNPITFLYNLGHVTLWCWQKCNLNISQIFFESSILNLDSLMCGSKSGLVANAREGSMQEHNRARVTHTFTPHIHTQYTELVCVYLLFSDKIKYIYHVTIWCTLFSLLFPYQFSLTIDQSGHTSWISCCNLSIEHIQPHHLHIIETLVYAY